MGIITWGDSLWERQIEVERKRQEEADLAVARRARTRRESMAAKTEKPVVDRDARYGPIGPGGPEILTGRVG